TSRRMNQAYDRADQGLRGRLGARPLPECAVHAATMKDEGDAPIDKLTGHRRAIDLTQVKIQHAGRKLRTIANPSAFSSREAATTLAPASCSRVVTSSEINGSSSKNATSCQHTRFHDAPPEARASRPVREGCARKHLASVRRQTASRRSTFR